MNTIEIPLDPITARGLHGRDERVGLIALTALQSGQARDETSVLSPEAECPDEAKADAASLPAMVGADEVEAFDWPDAMIDAATPSVEPMSSSATNVAGTHTTRDASSASVAASADAPPLVRAGDVYIAHYYARLPGDANRNPYTRLGGPAPHA